jgi:hypothetical protein
MKKLLITILFLLMATSALAMPPMYGGGGGSGLTSLSVTVTNYTSATVTYTASDLSGNYVTNSGASGAQTANIPACTTVGNYFTVFTMTAQTIKIEPNGTDQIMIFTDAAGDSLTSDGVIGTKIKLICLATGKWYPDGWVGVWTDTN